MSVQQKQNWTKNGFLRNPRTNNFSRRTILNPNNLNFVEQIRLIPLIRYSPKTIVVYLLQHKDTYR